MNQENLLPTISSFAVLNLGMSELQYAEVINQKLIYSKIRFLFCPSRRHEKNLYLRDNAN